MKKSLYIAAFAALALTACSSEEDRIFDQSAADRLEQYKKDYAEVLTSNGGLWRMEYFANEEEPGYVFLMKFDKDGSVTMSANHKWIGGTFKQETSLWKMIADNGPVLSFNSYNNLFHIFADPSNITGPNAPTGDYGDIDETGFGHEGDYEFQVMEVSDDKNTIRLLGKKRLYTIYLHRVTEALDAEEYMQKVADATSFVSPYFDYFNLEGADGSLFIVQGIDTGVVSISPSEKQNGDPVEQTRTGNVVFTPDGMRFMKALEVPKMVWTGEYDEDGNKIYKVSEDPFMAYEFKFQPDGTLMAEDGSRIVGPYPYDVFTFETFDYVWNVDLETVNGIFADSMEKLKAGIVAAYPAKTLESVYFGFDVDEGEAVPTLYVKLSGTKAAAFIMNYVKKTEEGIQFEVVSKNSNANALCKTIPALTDFVDVITSGVFVCSSDDIMKPEQIRITDTQSNAYMDLVIE